MQPTSLATWTHEHSFGQEQIKAGERRTRLVIALTGSMMVVEIAAGVVFGSWRCCGWHAHGLACRRPHHLGGCLPVCPQICT